MDVRNYHMLRNASHNCYLTLGILKEMTSSVWWLSTKDAATMDEIINKWKRLFAPGEQEQQHKCIPIVATVYRSYWIYPLGKFPYPIQNPNFSVQKSLLLKHKRPKVSLSMALLCERHLLFLHALICRLQSIFWILTLLMLEIVYFVCPKP